MPFVFSHCVLVVQRCRAQPWRIRGFRYYSLVASCHLIASSRERRPPIRHFVAWNSHVFRGVSGFQNCISLWESQCWLDYIEYRFLEALRRLDSSTPEWCPWRYLMIHDPCDFQYQLLPLLSIDWFFWGKMALSMVFPSCCAGAKEGRLCLPKLRCSFHLPLDGDLMSVAFWTFPLSVSLSGLSS